MKQGRDEEKVQARALRVADLAGAGQVPITFAKPLSRRTLP